jgi:hypothetical protein
MVKGVTGEKARIQRAAGGDLLLASQAGNPAGEQEGAFNGGSPKQADSSVPPGMTKVTGETAAHSLARLEHTPRDDHRKRTGLPAEAPSESGGKFGEVPAGFFEQARGYTVAEARGAEHDGKQCRDF